MASGRLPLRSGCRRPVAGRGEWRSPSMGTCSSPASAGTCAGSIRGAGPDPGSPPPPAIDRLWGIERASDGKFYLCASAGCRLLCGTTPRPKRSRTSAGLDPEAGARRPLPGRWRRRLPGSFVGYRTGEDRRLSPRHEGGSPSCCRNRNARRVSTSWPWRGTAARVRAHRQAPRLSVRTRPGVFLPVRDLARVCVPGNVHNWEYYEALPEWAVGHPARSPDALRIGEGPHAKVIPVHLPHGRHPDFPSGRGAEQTVYGSTIMPLYTSALHSGHAEAGEPRPRRPRRRRSVLIRALQRHIVLWDVFARPADAV